MSQHSVHVVLWNESAEGIVAGGKFNATAQVFIDDQPADVSAVTFRFGIDFPPFATAVNYTGVSAGAPGLYRAEITVSASDLVFVAVPLEVVAENGAEVARATRTVMTMSPTSPPPAAEWTLSAGLANYAALGERARPGDTMVFQVEARQNGVLTDALSLQVTLSATIGGIFEMVNATTTRTAPGVYLVPYTVPAGLNISALVDLQAQISENNSASASAQGEVWFYDTFAHFSQMNATQLRGFLAVGDGRDPLAGLNVDLAVFEDGNPFHVVGTIAGTTDASGNLLFNIANDGTQYLRAEGWINGSAHERVSRAFQAATYQGPPAPDMGRLDAVPMGDYSRSQWAGTLPMAFTVYDNGTPYTNSNVLVFVSSARGLWQAQNLTTDGSGVLDVSVDFDSAPDFAFDDVVSGGVIFTFRVPQGSDASSFDGQWWGEDEEVITFDFTTAFINSAVDTNISITMQTAALGVPFGIASSYDGPVNHTGWASISAVVPGGLDAITGQGLAMEQSWTATGMPRASYMAASAQVGDFFGCGFVPTYWGDNEYTLLNLQVPSFSSLGSSGLSPEMALTWRSFQPTGSFSEFTPGPDILPPEVYAPASFQGDAGAAIALVAHAYDDSIDFCTQATYNWTVPLPTGTFRGSGVGSQITIDVPGTYDGTLVVSDGSGRNTTVAFQVVVRDVVAPIANAGADIAVVTGQAVTFNASGSTDDDPLFPVNAGFEWLFSYNGSQQVLGGMSATFTFWVPGTYDVELWIADSGGNEDNDTVRVTVTPWDTIAPTVDAGAAVSGWTNSNITLAGSASDNDPGFAVGGRFWWTFEAGGTPYNLSGAALDFRFVLAGTYTLTLWAMDPTGNIANDTVAVTVEVADLIAPMITAIADMTVDEDVEAHFEATATDNAANFSTVGLYRWTFTEGVTPVVLTGAHAHYTFAAAAHIVVTLTVTDGSANAASITFSVHVRARDVTAPTIQITASQVNVALGATASLSATATDAGSALTNDSAFWWTFTYKGSAVNLTGRSVSFKFDEAGTYNVTLTVVDAAGNRQTSSAEVVVASAPPAATFDPLLIVLLVLALAGVAGAVLMMKRTKGAVDHSAPSDDSAGKGNARSGPGGGSDSSAGAGSAGSDKRTGGPGVGGHGGGGGGGSA